MDAGIAADCKCGGRKTEIAVDCKCRAGSYGGDCSWLRIGFETRDNRRVSETRPLQMSRVLEFASLRPGPWSLVAIWLFSFGSEGVIERTGYVFVPVQIRQFGSKMVAAGSSDVPGRVLVRRNHFPPLRNRVETKGVHPSTIGVR